MELNPDGKLVTLAVFHTEFQATLLADELKRAGVRAEPCGTFTADFRADAPGSVKVLVWEEDLEAARAVMADHAASRGGLDWDQVDVGDPEEDA